MKCRYIVLLIMLLTACSNRTAIPNDIIVPDSMQVIMRDVFLANEYALQFISKDSLRPDKIKANQEMLDQIFKIHRITKEEFKKSLKFYESRPDLNKKIFDSLAAYVNRHKQELNIPRTSVNGKPIPANPVKPGKTPVIRAKPPTAPVN